MSLLTDIIAKISPRPPEKNVNNRFWAWIQEQIEKIRDALSEYEEGSFTPELSFGGATTGITYSSRDAQYTRIGNRVIYDIRLVLTSKGSATGSASVGVLPFTNAGNALLQCRLQNVTAGVGDTDLVTVGAATSFSFQKVVTGVYTSLTDADFTNTTDILISGVVRI